MVLRVRLEQQLMGFGCLGFRLCGLVVFGVSAEGMVGSGCFG